MSRIHEALKKAEQERGANRPAGAADASPAVAAIPAPAIPLPPDSLLAATRSVAVGEIPTLEFLSRVKVAAWKPNPKGIVAFHGGDAHSGTEEFRSLRSRLYQSRDSGPLRKVIVTSAVPQEGKTYVAANLVHSIVRQKERRALLIDGDLRKSRLHEVLGTPISPGLTEYLKGEADEISILQRGAIENLYFIAGGNPVPNPSELISNGRLKLLLERLTPLFDWVIIDSPPCITMSDASLMAEFCDGVLVVVAAGKTPFDLAQKTREQLKKFRVLGVVLNKVDPQYTGGRYYYNYYKGSVSNGKKKGA
ncbi:MAG: CpsD/CapB family tyrosine-protein kinase [Acidobacteria bacterium]|nr:CpsD/CapB family tyrosine-protein kinase [Acidobacteriota bacterium]